jgi:hypothetical protein
MGPPGLAAQGTDDDPTSGPLGTVAQLLREAHKRFFAWYDEAGSTMCAEKRTTTSGSACLRTSNGIPLQEVHNGVSDSLGKVRGSVEDALDGSRDNHVCQAATTHASDRV